MAQIEHEYRDAHGAAVEGTVTFLSMDTNTGSPIRVELVDGDLLTDLEPGDYRVSEDWVGGAIYGVRLPVEGGDLYSLTPVGLHARRYPNTVERVVVDDYLLEKHQRDVSNVHGMRNMGSVVHYKSGRRLDGGNGMIMETFNEDGAVIQYLLKVRPDGTLFTTLIEDEVA